MLNLLAILIKGGIEKHAEVQKEGSGHGSVLSGPPFEGKFVVFGLRSTEWLKDHHGMAGIVFYS